MESDAVRPTFPLDGLAIPVWFSMTVNIDAERYRPLAKPHGIDLQS